MAAGEQSGDLAQIWRKDGIERGTKNGREASCWQSKRIHASRLEYPDQKWMDPCSFLPPAAKETRSDSLCPDG